MGGLAHRVFKRHLEDGPIPTEQFTNVCRQEIGDSNLNYKMASLEIKPSTLTPIIEEVRALYERFVRFPEQGFAGAEVQLRHQTDDGVTLVGMVDAVFDQPGGGQRLVDWKTGDLGDAEDQLDFYTMLWALERQSLPLVVEAVSVGTGESHRQTPSLGRVEVTVQEVVTMVNQLRQAWREGQSVPLRAGPWCRYCPILSDCAEGQSAEALLRP